MDFFISIKDGLVDSVANKLLEHSDVTYVGKSIGNSKKFTDKSFTVCLGLPIKTCCILVIIE